MSTLDKNLLLEMFRKMEEIRRMDLKIAQLVKKGKVPGMTHFSVGEEAANVGAMLALNPDDLITSNHRGHGQAIAKGIDLNGMMAEILGKYTGTCKGKGGSMHIADLDAGNLGANGIVGGGMGIAVGAALSQQMQHTGKIVVCFFGDGATNEGVFHEAVNMASIWKLPVIFYCINNGYGISADIKKMTNVEHIHQRSAAYGIPGMFIEDGNNVIDVYEGFKKAVDHVRGGNGPVLIESVTYRWLGLRLPTAPHQRPEVALSALPAGRPRARAFRHVLPARGPGRHRRRSGRVLRLLPGTVLPRRCGNDGW